MKITFLVPGFSKCGTTTLCALLAQHPDIFMPGVKEPNFFSAENYDSLWPFYESLFEEAKSQRAIGEGSTFYSNFRFEEVARERILDRYPEIKLIFIARDPLERIESLYRELHHSGPKFGQDAPYDMEAAIEQFPALIADTLYWSRINNYRLHMPEEQIHVVFLEDLKSNAKEELKKCFEFLDVDNRIAITNTSIQLNAGGEKLYDSSLLRRIRKNRHTGFKIARIPVATQNRIFRFLGLRKPFRSAIEWDQKTRKTVLARLGDETAIFLEHYGKSPDFWPCMQS